VSRLVHYNISTRQRTDQTEKDRGCYTPAQHRGKAKAAPRGRWKNNDAANNITIRRAGAS